MSAEPKTTAEHFEEGGPSTIPCPPWCDLAPGHPFNQLDSYDLATAVLVRSHSRSMSAPHTARAVELCQDERALTPDGPLDLGEASPPLIYAEAEDDHLTADQARSFAADLIAAADALDALPAVTQLGWPTEFRNDDTGHGGHA